MKSGFQVLMFSMILVLTLLVPGLYLIEPSTASLGWTQANADGFGFSAAYVSCDSMATYNSKLYSDCSSGFFCKLMAYDGASWTQVNIDDFGPPPPGKINHNEGIQSMAVFKGQLYVGTFNYYEGCEVWRTSAAGGPPYTDWAQVNASGFETSRNTGAWCMAADANRLYAGTCHLDQGCQIWSYDGSDWQMWGMLGLIDANNLIPYSMVIFNSKLYVGISNSNGCGIWRYDGPTRWDWTQVNAPGFGDTENSAVYSMAASGGQLYAGTSNAVTGGEVWRYDGTAWIQENTDGFGDMNSYVVQSLADYEGCLYAGVRNDSSGAEVWKTPLSYAYYFAEGTCRPGFEPYICIQNPQNTDAAVHITYMLGNGSVQGQNLTVVKNSRSTVNVKSFLGEGDDAAHDFSARVDSTNGVQIVAERPMYFDYKGAWAGGHCVMGALSPSSAFYFAEGTCRPGFEPYICIQNPQDEGQEVLITYMLGDGNTKQQSLKLTANSRSTVNVKSFLGEGDDAAHDFSAKVEAVQPGQIIAERPMYFDYKGAWAGGHCVMGLHP